MSALTRPASYARLASRCASKLARLPEEGQPLISERPARGEAQSEAARRPERSEAGVHSITIAGEELVDLSVLVRHLPGVGIIFFVNTLIFWGLVVSAPFAFDKTLQCKTGVPQSANMFFFGICTSSIFLELMAAFFSVRGQRMLKKRRFYVVFLLGIGALGRFDAYSDITFISIARKCDSWVWPYSLAIFVVGVICLQMLPGFYYLARFIFYNGDPYRAVMYMDMHILLETIDPTELAKGQMEVQVDKADLELPPKLEGETDDVREEGARGEADMAIELQAKTVPTAAGSGVAIEPAAERRKLVDANLLQVKRASKEQKREEAVKALREATESRSVVQIQDALSAAYKVGLDADLPEVESAVKLSNDLLFTKVLVGRVKVFLGFVRFFTEDLLQGTTQVLFLTDGHSRQQVSQSNRWFTIASVACGVTVSLSGPIYAWFSQWTANKQVSERVKIQLRSALQASNVRKLEPSLLELQRIITPDKPLAKRVDRALADIDRWRETQASQGAHGLFTESALIDHLLSGLKGEASAETFQGALARLAQERADADDALQAAIRSKSVPSLVSAVGAGRASPKLLKEAKKLLGEEERRAAEKESARRGLKEAMKLKDATKLTEALKSARLLGVDESLVADAQSQLRTLLQETEAGDGDEGSSAIVVAVGCSRVRAGWGGNDSPTVVIPTVVNRGTGRSVVGVTSNDAVIGSQLCYPLDAAGVVQDWDLMEEVWHALFYNELRVPPEDHPVLATVPMLNPKACTEKLTQILFETFNVPAFYATQASILAMYASGRTTGLTLRCGTNGCEAVPIYEGYVLPHAVQRSQIGATHLAGYLNVLLLRAGKPALTYSQVEQGVFHGNLLYVASDYGRELSNTPFGIAKETAIWTGCCLDLERFMCAEALFQPQLLVDAHVVALMPLGANEAWKPQGPQIALDEAVQKSVDKCDADVRRDLYSNIVLSGGLSMTEGLADRLSAELRTRLGTAVKVIAPPERAHSAWIGGSILASLSTFQEMWVSKMEYEEGGPGIVHRKFW